MVDTYEMMLCLMNNKLEKYDCLREKEEKKRIERIFSKKQIRNCKEYYLFKRNVIRRYKNTCYKCSSKDDIEVHHIKPVNKYPELVFEVNNGMCLCYKCHRELHQRIGY